MESSREAVREQGTLSLEGGTVDRLPTSLTWTEDGLRGRSRDDTTEGDGAGRVGEACEVSPVTVASA